MGSGLAISLFILPLDFSNGSAHCSIMYANIFCYIFWDIAIPEVILIHCLVFWLLALTFKDLIQGGSGHIANMT